MFRIEFELADHEPEGHISGFDLGHMTIVGEFGQESSKNRSPDQAMMIFISLVDLMDGIRRFLIDDKNIKYEFIGADSSFAVGFEKEKNGTVLVHKKKKPIARINRGELVVAILHGANNFLHNPNRQLATDDTVHDDLDSALSEFKIYVSTIEK